jgi:hypothetical protein
MARIGHRLGQSLRIGFALAVTLAPSLGSQLSRSVARAAEPPSGYRNVVGVSGLSSAQMNFADPSCEPSFRGGNCQDCCLDLWRSYCAERPYPHACSPRHFPSGACGLGQRVHGGQAACGRCSTGRPEPSAAAVPPPPIQPAAPAAVPPIQATAPVAVPPTQPAAPIAAPSSQPAAPALEYSTQSIVQPESPPEPRNFLPAEIEPPATTPSPTPVVPPDPVRDDLEGFGDDFDAGLDLEVPRNITAPDPMPLDTAPAIGEPPPIPSDETGAAHMAKPPLPPGNGVAAGPPTPSLPRIKAVAVRPNAGTARLLKQLESN